MREGWEKDERRMREGLEKDEKGWEKDWRKMGDGWENGPVFGGWLKPRQVCSPLYSPTWYPELITTFY